jgi:hypothetical protein
VVGIFDRWRVVIAGLVDDLKQHEITGKTVNGCAVRRLS